MKNIIDEINIENGSNYKMGVLKKYKDNDLLQRVLKMTYDKVTYTYGISMKNIRDTSDSTIRGKRTLTDCLDIIEKEFCTRNTTGNAAIDLLEDILRSVSGDDEDIIKKIINRDQRINLGRTNINKVFKNLIVKIPYTRCEIGTKANITKNMPMDSEGNFINKVYSQEKMDGTFRRASVNPDDIEITSRPGIETKFPIIEEQLKVIKEFEGYTLIGEMTLRGEKDRKKGNGLINSGDIPHEDVIFTVWDMIPAQEFGMTKDQIKQAEKDGTLSLYEDRLETLEKLLTDTELENVKMINYKIIKNMREAYEHFQEVTRDGGEGTVIKSHDMTHKDGNSKKQLKVKLEIHLDMRCTGFTEGKKGTKREQWFGAMTFENDEKTIIGQCSGFPEDLLEEINSNRESFIGRVFEIKCNDITLARGKTAHALSHGNFKSWRSKDETDTLERALELKEMAMELV